tara:strand:- start:51 stop:677 length:627 start_codon:yes stop_codon:yes gene_type:complete
MSSITKTKQLLIAKKEKQIEIAKRQLYMLENNEYVSRTIITINVCIPLPKIMTAGILPSEIFEKIFDFVRAIEEREEREERERERKYIEDGYCECDNCGCGMTHQEYDHMEQTARDEIIFTEEDEDFMENNPCNDIYCGIVCREKLNGDAEDCVVCGDTCHIQYDDGIHFNLKSDDEDRIERMGYNSDEWICEFCVENWDSDEEEEEE